MRYALPLLVGASLAAVEPSAGWAARLAAHDPVWHRLPTSYFDGPFVGNGLVGTLLTEEPGRPGTLRFEIGRTDVWDHRPTGPVFHYRCRLPIGQLLVTPVGRVTAVDLRVDLWQAELVGTITTEAGSLGLRCWTPSGGSAVLWDLRPTGGEQAVTVTFRPQRAASPRWLAQPNRDKNFTYDPNPPFTVRREGDAEVVEQPLKAGSDYATAWAEDRRPDGTRQVALVVANRRGEGREPATGSGADALATLARVRAEDPQTREAAHRAWWAAYYPASRLEIPDHRVAAFYHLQQYKLASATRPDRPVVDLMGPWFKVTVWPSYWHNLNTQLSYSTAVVTNHPDFQEPLTSLLVRRQADLIANVPKEWRDDSAGLGRVSGFDDLRSPGPGPAVLKPGQHYQFIALPWLMQLAHQHVRSVGDDARLQRDILPLLERALQPLVRTLTTGEDGTLRLPRCYSDEFGPADGTNQDLALLRWGLTTLRDEYRRLGVDHPHHARWEDVLTRLQPFFVDPATGYMIGGGQTFDKSHRHSGHLFQVAPFHVVHPDDDPDLRPLIEKSLRHFTSLVGDECLFKFTATASLWATIGNGDEALRWIHRALTPQATGPTIGANTLYSENGWQTFESPLSAARAVTDLLLQYRRGVIHVFPAVPTAWPTTGFRDLRTEGAVLVSGQRRAGQTAWVRLRAEVAGPVRVVTDLRPPVVADGRPVTVDARGVITLDLAAGQTVLLTGAGPVGSLDLDAQPDPVGEAHRWGLP